MTFFLPPHLFLNAKPPQAHTGHEGAHISEHKSDLYGRYIGRSTCFTGSDCRIILERRTRGTPGAVERVSYLPWPAGVDLGTDLWAWPVPAGAWVCKHFFKGYLGLRTLPEAIALSFIQPQFTAIFVKHPKGPGKRSSVSFCFCAFLYSVYSNLHCCVESSVRKELLSSTKTVPQFCC